MAKHGCVYNPNFILDFVGYSSTKTLRKHVTDNSCGNGAFRNSRYECPGRPKRPYGMVFCACYSMIIHLLGNITVKCLNLLRIDCRHLSYSPSKSMI
ncbi:MAG: hypothetical protein ACI358_00575 [Candidatus Limimorpha sp.]